ncbi:hypothetical protein ACE1B6_13715 [Aerosakkonemataceae cyanobacterium BLCC-F154]|uniref:Uncharacterized protein n=1 Tax=Floridaenema fluviatile BLCC-F154 TaxID=3153640 RepID=A0ABV4YBV7_9CYAN
MMNIPKHSSKPVLESRKLNYHDAYSCPVCRYGHISVLTLTEAFACDFCRHIFTANIEEQVLIMADSTPPMAWRWTGRNWKIANQKDSELSFVVWLLGMALVIFPTLIVGVSTYIFPPEEGSSQSAFPLVWLGLTFLSHLILVLWLLAESYQLPFYTYVKVKIRNWLNR